MNTKNIDILNNLAILLSLGIAIFIPFELFIIAYAILGPLHYLTEIKWLETKSYFMKIDKRWIYTLVLSAIIFSVVPFVAVFFRTFFIEQKIFFEEYYHFSNHVIVFSILVGLMFGLIQKNKHVLVVFPLLILVTLLLGFFLQPVSTFIVMMVPTLIHVFVFTFIFVLIGYTKNRSVLSLITVILMAISLVIIIYLPMKPTSVNITDSILERFSNSGFSGLNVYLNNLLELNGNEKYSPLSVAGYKLQIFIAFAYTYHYLNWFTKTTVIGWKNSLTKQSSIIILLIWLFSVSLYLYDYKVGFAALFTLSFVHVLFELPLNMQSLKILIHPNKKVT